MGALMAVHLANSWAMNSAAQMAENLGQCWVDKMDAKTVESMVGNLAER
jgi:hypothetical protein